MTGYYHQRVKAFEIAGGLAEKGKHTLGEIVLSTIEITGVSEKLVEKYIQKKIDEGFFEINKGGIIIPIIKK